jgi:hypothetical protein
LLVEIPIYIYIYICESADICQVAVLHAVLAQSSLLASRCAGAGRDQDGVDRMRMGRRRDEDGKWTGRILALCNGATCMVRRSCDWQRPNQLRHHYCWRGHGFKSGDDRSSKSIIIVHRSSTSISIGRRKQSASFMDHSHRYVAGTAQLGHSHIDEDRSEVLLGLQTPLRWSIGPALQTRRELSQ